jgi:hypothetical protein
MKRLLVTIAVAALAGVPLAAQAQDRDGYARSAMGHGYDAGARVNGERRGDARYGRVDRDRFTGDRSGADRGFDRDRGDRRFRGNVAFGFGYGADYPYGGGYGYGDDYPYGGYGAEDTYSYPDEYGTYQPFAYDYSDRDDAYYAGGPAYGYGYEAAPNVGWSEGGPPVDCGRWVWRDDRGAYQWVARACR